MNQIKTRIIQFLVGEEMSSSEDYLANLSQAQEMIKVGVESDADAILYAYKANKKINVLGVVGKSLVQGPDLNKYLEHYFADSGGLEGHKIQIADYIYNDIKGRSGASMVLKSDDKRWRAFVPVKNLDDVLAGAMNS